MAAALGLLTKSGLAAGGLLTGCGLAAAGRGVGFAAAGRDGAAGGFWGAAGRGGGADDFTGAGAGLLMVGLGVAAAGGFGAACGLATTWGLAATGLAATGLAATGLAATGLLGPAGAAFFTDRMAFPGAGLAGAAVGGLVPFPPLLSSERILPASASLIELLWLFAAIDSFSAASRTSWFSRTRSLDSS